jgi:hypothetical protein
MKITKLSKDLHALLLYGLLALAAGSAAAQDAPVSLDIALTATVQRDLDWFPGYWSSGHTASIRWTTRDVFSLTAAALGVTFPRGSYLALYGEDVVVVSKNWNIITNLSSLFTFSTTSNYVLNGTLDKATSCALVSIKFDDHKGNSFVLYGQNKRTFSMHSPISQTSAVAFSLTFSGAGNGTVAGNTAVFSGGISGAGRRSFGPLPVGYTYGPRWLTFGSQTGFLEGPSPDRLAKR